MIAVFLKAHVRPGKKAELIEFLKWDGQVARDEEPGTLRFDVYEDDQDENVVYIYEAYVDEAAFEVHKANPPFQKFANGLREECIASMEPIVRGWSVPVWPPAE